MHPPKCPLFLKALFLVPESLKAQVSSMSKNNMSPIPVRFSEELMTRVDAISKSTALSHASVMRLAVNQWFEAGGDKSGILAPAKKAANKAASKKPR